MTEEDDMSGLFGDDPVEEDVIYDDGVSVVCASGNCTFERDDYRGNNSPTGCTDCGNTRPAYNMWQCSCGENLCYDCFLMRRDQQEQQEQEAAAQREAEQAAEVARKDQEKKSFQEQAVSKKAALQWGHGFDAAQGSTREWPLNFYHLKVVDVGKRNRIASIGMRFNANPTRGVKMKLAVFSCLQPANSSVCSIGKLLGRVKGVVELKGSEIGVNEFPLEEPISLAPGRYYIMTFMGGTVNPNGFFDHVEKQEYMHSSFYTTAANIDVVLTPDYQVPTSWTAYHSRMSWWLTGKIDVDPRKAYTPFIEQLEYHLTPKIDKTYAPPFPEGWHEDEQVKFGVLSVACELGSGQVVEFLLDFEEVKPNHFFNGATPLMVSAAFGHAAIVTMLLAKKASVSLKSESDCPLGADRDALLCACNGAKGRCSGPAVVTVLLENKASVDAVDENKRGCLHLASAVAGAEEVVPLLLRAGADLELRDEFGETALLCASSKNNPSIVALLLEANAELFVTDKAGRTALHLACYYGATSVVERLLEAKATSQVDRKDQEGLTPLAVAAARAHSCISALLKNAYASLGYSVCWGITAGDGARHHIETHKLSCIRIAVPVQSLASHIGICLFDSTEWGEAGEMQVGLFADKEGVPDVTQLLARGQGKIDPSCKGKETLFALDHEVPLAQGSSYWAAFVSNIMTVVAKDARVKEKNRTYLQCTSLDTCWDEAKSLQWKQHQCSLALFIQTKNMNHLNETTPLERDASFELIEAPVVSPAVILHVPS